MGAVENVRTLPIAERRNVIDFLEQLGVVTKQAVNFVCLPDVVLAFDAFAVGIEGAGEGGLGGGIVAGGADHHFPLQPAYRLADTRGVEGFLGDQPGLGQQLDQQSVVVQHFLEMRHQPEFVGAVARVTAAQVVIDAALRQLVECQGHGFAVKRRRRRTGHVPEKFEHGGLRKFRRPRCSAAHRIDDAEQHPRRMIQNGHRWFLPALGLGLLLQCRAQCVRVGDDGFLLRPVGFGDPLQDIWKAGPSIARGRRKISATPERLAVWRQEHGQRPAAVFAHQRQRGLINVVHVRPLFPVDLDIDEVFVHQRRGAVGFEAFMRHDVAPMTSGVTDRQQDRLVVAPRLIEGLRAPRPPMHGIILMLQQIGTCFVDEQVGHGRGVPSMAVSAGRLSALPVSPNLGIGHGD